LLFYCPLVRLTLEIVENGEPEVDLLNVLCAEGMRCVGLDQIQRVRFLNPTLDSEFRRALEVLAASHDSQKKSVSLNFKGEGKRTVRVGYVVESPIWKTSYRLVQHKDGSLYLQGWAAVENTSSEDWSNIRMVLVSGRPIGLFAAPLDARMRRQRIRPLVRLVRVAELHAKPLRLLRHDVERNPDRRAAVQAGAEVRVKPGADSDRLDQLHRVRCHGQCVDPLVPRVRRGEDRALGGARQPECVCGGAA